MKKLLNTLYVTSQGAYLSKEGETVVVKVDGEVRLRVPIHTIGGIVCFGNVGCSPFLMGFCAENQVGLSFLTEHGRFLARVQGAVSGNVLLRREQYRRADDPVASAEMAKSVLTGKIANCRSVLQGPSATIAKKIDEQQVRHASRSSADKSSSSKATFARRIEGLEAIRTTSSASGSSHRRPEGDIPLRRAQQKASPRQRQLLLLSSTRS